MAARKPKRISVELPQTILKQSSVRAYYNWTPAIVRAAELQADGGSLRAAADVCDWILTSERARATLETRVSTLLGAPLSFDKGLTEGALADKVVEGLDKRRDWWHIFPEPQTLQVMMWGLLLGVCPYRLYPWAKRDGRLVPTINFWHPKWLRHDFPTGKWFVTTGVAGTVGPEVELTPGNAEWGLYAPFGLEQPWRMGLWRGDSRWRLLEHFATDDMGRASEQAARLVISTTEQAYKAARSTLANEIMVMGKDGVIFLPPGCAANLIQNLASTKEVYGYQIELAHAGYAISHLGQNLTTEVKGGSFAAAQVSEGVEAKRVRYDDQVESTIFHDQVLVPYCSVNYGNPDLAPYSKRKVEPPKDWVRWAETLAKAVPALIKLADEAGVPVDWKKVCDNLEIPWEEGKQIIEEIVQAARDAKNKARANTPGSGKPDEGAQEGEQEGEPTPPEPPPPPPPAPKPGTKTALPVAPAKPAKK